MSPAVWDKTFRGLSTNAKLVSLYVLTCRNRISEGLFELSAGQIALDTALSENEALDALRELYAANIVLYDPDAELVLDTRALRTFPIKRTFKKDKETGELVEQPPDKRLKPAVELFRLLPDSPLKVKFLDLADEHSPLLADAIRAATGGMVEAPSEDVATAMVSPIEGTSREEASSEEKSRAEAPASPQGSSLSSGDDCIFCCKTTCECAQGSASHPEGRFA